MLFISGGARSHSPLWTLTTATLPVLQLLAAVKVFLSYSSVNKLSLIS